MATKDVIPAHSTPHLDKLPHKADDTLTLYREDVLHLAAKLSANYPTKENKKGVNGVVLRGSLAKRTSCCTL